MVRPLTDFDRRPVVSFAWSLEGNLTISPGFETSNAVLVRQVK